MFSFVLAAYRMVFAIADENNQLQGDLPFRMAMSNVDAIPNSSCKDQNHTWTGLQNSYNCRSQARTCNVSIKQNETRNDQKVKNIRTFGQNIRVLHKDCPAQCYRKIAILSWYNSFVKLPVNIISCLICFIVGSCTVFEKFIKALLYMIDPIAFFQATILAITLMTPISYYADGRPRIRDFSLLLLITSFLNRYSLKIIFRIIFRIVLQGILVLLHTLTRFANVLIWFANSEFVTDALKFSVGLTVVCWTYYGLQKGWQSTARLNFVHVIAFFFGLMTYQRLLYLVFCAADLLEYALNNAMDIGD